MNTETIDKLFLELSQFTDAKTEREIRLEVFVEKHRRTELRLEEELKKAKDEIRNLIANKDITLYGTFSFKMGQKVRAELDTQSFIGTVVGRLIQETETGYKEEYKVKSGSGAIYWFFRNQLTPITEIRVQTTINLPHTYKFNEGDKVRYGTNIGTVKARTVQKLGDMMNEEYQITFEEPSFQWINGSLLSKCDE